MEGTYSLADIRAAGKFARIRFWQPMTQKRVLQMLRTRMQTVRRCQHLQFLARQGHDRAEQEEDDAMREIEIHTYARQLLEAHGPRAIAEAAQNALELESKGETELAKTWRHIEDAMKLMRGPHQG